MSDWKIRTGIAFGGLSVVAVVAALASGSGTQRAQTLGLTRHGELAVAVDAGAADVVGLTGIAPGTPTQVLTVSDSGVPVWRTPAGGTVTASQISDSTTTGRSVLTAATPAAGMTALRTVLYASNCVAANGAGADATASISGSGSGSTVTLGVSSTSRLCNSSAIAAGSLTCTLPAGARRVALYMRATALSGFSTGGNRYLTSSIRWAGEGAPAAVLWGVASKDSNGGTLGDMRSNSNATQHTFSPTHWPLAAINTWARIRWDLEIPTVSYSSAAVSASFPVRWTFANIITASQAGPTASTMGSVPVGSDAQVVICLESYGTGGASSVTLEPTLVVE